MLESRLLMGQVQPVIVADDFHQVIVGISQVIVGISEVKTSEI